LENRLLNNPKDPLHYVYIVAYDDVLLMVPVLKKLYFERGLRGERSQTHHYVLSA